MIQPRTITKGAEYESALAEERAKSRPRFAEHLKALLVTARVPPHGSIESPSVRNRRIAEATDEANGYVVYLVFDIDPDSFDSALRWIESYDV